MMLVERNVELQMLERALAESSKKEGRVVLVEGPASSGRTELLRTFTDQTAASGVLFLTASSSRAERALPFGVVSQLFAGAPLSASLRDRVSELLDAGTRRADPGDQDIIQVFHGLWLALLELTAHTTVVLAVDDLHHADLVSVKCLLHLIRRIGSMPCLVVLTGADDFQDQQMLPFRAELLRQPTLDRIQLAPLSPDGATELIARRLGEGAARRAPWFCEVSGGNPLLLNALIDDHAEDGAAPGQAYRLALLSCLHRADPALLRVARALAVLGGETAVLAELARLDDDVVRCAVRTMSTVGLLDGTAFRHPAARAAVLDELSSHESAELHRRAARSLHERGADAPTVARHLVAAQSVVGTWAVSALVEASEQALFAGQAAAAADCLKLAHRSTSDEPKRTTVLMRLAHAEWQISPSAAAQHLTPLVAAARGDRLDRTDRLVLVRWLLWLGRVDEAVELLNRLRDNAPEPGTEPADVEQWLAASHPALARRHQPSPNQRDAALIAPIADRWLRSAATLSGALMCGKPGGVIEVLGDIHFGRNTTWAEESAALALTALICAEETETALEWCDRLSRDARYRGSTAARAFCLATRAEIMLRQGDLPAAVTHAEAALAELPAKAWGVTVGLPMGTLVMANTRMGRYDEAAKALTLSVPEAMFQSRWGLPYLHARGHHYLATNHAHAALADFLSCGELMRTWGLDVPGLVPWRTSAAEAWLRLGNKDQARRLVYDQLGRPGIAGSRTRGVALRLLAMTSSAGRRTQLLAEALEVFEDTGDRFEQARVLSDLSHAYSALEENRRARLLLRRALHVANMCEARPLAGELLTLSGDQTGVAPIGIGSGRDDLELLTRSERRVASLAVMGHTNREIAAKLFITPSTVEQHLTRVYRKLRIKRRRDLPVDLWCEATRTG
ncbi:MULTISPECIES: AAA family ATPase [unclassified Streptomyces]|uniref:helix-turn-helix transcriptional regulator n=1 Tax=unclassified Streptomyces TaxID=2593676 RepID=UPI0033D52662